jgi:hypothetical protein
MAKGVPTAHSQRYKATQQAKEKISSVPTKSQRYIFRLTAYQYWDETQRLNTKKDEGIFDFLRK